MTLTRLIETTEPLPIPDVQRTTLALDVLGRFVCNTLDEALVNPDFDVVVIGAGMYGAYCAAKLFTESRDRRGTPLRILVLEAGPFLVPEHVQNIPDIGLGNPFRPPFDTFSPAAQQTNNLVWGAGWRGNVGFPGTAYCVGGKSLYWGGWCPRLRDEDLAQWPAEVRSYLTSPPAFGAEARERASVYEAVEYEIGVQPADDFIFDPVAGPNVPPTSVGLNQALRRRVETAIASAGVGGVLREVLPPPIAVQTQSFISGLFSLDKFSSLPGLISAVRSDPARGNDGATSLFVVPQAHVSRLVCPAIPKDGAAPASFRIHQLEVFHRGQRRLLNLKPTCTVVLALGAIESTRLALESFPTAPQRERNDELMGRNLMAHLRFDFPFRLDRAQLDRFARNQFNLPLADRLQTSSMHVQGFGQHGRFHLQLYSAANPANNPDALLYRMIPDREVARRLEDMENPTEIAVILRVCGEMAGRRDLPVGADGTSWIDLASAVDRDQTFDHARGYVHYAGVDALPIWREMYDAAVALASAMGGGGFPTFERVDRHEVGTTWHDSGTLWMGDDPAASVTDVNGRFHHIANAACVDQALFPTVGSANPVLTGLCLTRKVADEIVGRYVGRPALTAAEVQREQDEGFEFLFENDRWQRWRSNDGRPLLFLENHGILEVEGGGPLAVAFYDDPREFDDFELRLQWKAFELQGDLTANSGVFVRAPRPPQALSDENFYDRAVEIQIDETGYDFARRRFRSPLHRTGAVYGLAPARQWAAKVPSQDGTPGLWNEFRITLRGNGATVFLNGKQVSQGGVEGKRPAGVVGLQYHTGKVQFRAVRIRRFNP